VNKITLVIVTINDTLTDIYKFASEGDVLIDVFNHQIGIMTYSDDHYLLGLTLNANWLQPSVMQFNSLVQKYPEQIRFALEEIKRRGWPQRWSVDTDSVNKVSDRIKPSLVEGASRAVATAMAAGEQIDVVMGDKTIRYTPDDTHMGGYRADEFPTKVEVEPMTGTFEVTGYAGFKAYMFGTLAQMRKVNITTGFTPPDVMACSNEKHVAIAHDGVLVMLTDTDAPVDDHETPTEKLVHHLLVDHAKALHFALVTIRNLGWIPHPAVRDVTFEDKRVFPAMSSEEPLCEVCTIHSCRCPDEGPPIDRTTPADPHAEMRAKYEANPQKYLLQHRGRGSLWPWLTTMTVESKPSWDPKFEYRLLPGTMFNLVTGEPIKYKLADLDFSQVMLSAGYIGMGMKTELTKVHNSTGENSQLVNNGEVDTVNAAVQYAPALELAWIIASRDNECNGVWSYEIVEPFGEWFGAFIAMNQTTPDRQVVIQYIANAVSGWFLESQNDSKKRKELRDELTAAMTQIMTEVK
jgi:hypothetical protein